MTALRLPVRRCPRTRWVETFAGDPQRRHLGRRHRWHHVTDYVRGKAPRFRRYCATCGRQEVTADGRPPFDRARWGLTRNVQCWLNAAAWTVAIGLCVASVLATPVAPAVHV